MYYSYSHELAIETTKRIKREKRTDVLITEASWRICSDGSSSIPGSSLSIIYDSIKFTIGKESADGFWNRF